MCDAHESAVAPKETALAAFCKPRRVRRGMFANSSAAFAHSEKSALRSEPLFAGLPDRLAGHFGGLVDNRADFVGQSGAKRAEFSAFQNFQHFDSWSRLRLFQDSTISLVDLKRSIECSRRTPSHLKPVFLSSLWNVPSQQRKFRAK